MKIERQLGAIGVAIAAALTLSATGWANDSATGMQNYVSKAELEQSALDEDSVSPAHMRFEFHLASLGSTTGSRINPDEPGMSRPVRVVSAEEFQLGWRR